MNSKKLSCETLIIEQIMNIQYIIVSIVVGISILIAIYMAFKEIRENIHYKNYGCAGCALYKTCKRKKKK